MIARLSCALLLGTTLCAASGPPRPTTGDLFARLTALSGEWRGRDELGHDVHVTFRLVSNRTALLSELTERGDRDGSTEDMITMITVDGQRVLATHYCSAGNQPRMAAIAAPDANSVAFEFVDGTNLGAGGAGHMQRLVIGFLGADRHSEEWVYLDAGRENRNVIDLRRVRS
jgi:hypothetical protein